MASMLPGRVVVVGGANLDVVGHSFAPLVAEDSNPGFVRRSAGGVGRNIAENLARLGVETSLLTVFGNDVNAREVMDRCTSSGIDLSLSATVDLPGSLYLAILDDGGDMALALSDMRALERLTPAMLAERAADLAAADLIVIDANLPSESLAWLAEEALAPLVVDAVSTTKAERLGPYLSSFAVLKCNAAEASMLLGDQADRLDAEEIAERLNGVVRGPVFVTAAAGGVSYADATERGHLPAPHAAVANATGAGDAFTAGLVAAQLAGVTAPHAAAFGSALAALTLASQHTVSERVNPEVLGKAMKEWNR